LQYLFQCSCPSTSEEARYPESVDVLVSACLSPFAVVSKMGVTPNGRYTPIAIGTSSRQTYFHDRDTDTLTPFSFAWNVALTDDVILGTDRAGENPQISLYDLSGKRLSRLNRVVMPKDYHLDDMTISIFQRADKVFLLPMNLAVSLGSKHANQSEKNFVLDWQWDSAPNIFNQKVMKIFSDNGVKFELVSPGKSVVLPAEKKYLIGSETAYPISLNEFPVPQPLLRERLPLDQYASEARPRIEAQRLQEEENKAAGNRSVWLGIILWFAVLMIELIILGRGVKQKGLISPKPRSN
jgi:hypothetical protein